MRTKLLLALALAPLAACHNYTAAPLCTDQNVAVPPGVRGTYTVSLQLEDFSTVTQEVHVDFDDAAKRLTFAKADGTRATTGLCQVAGRFVSERQDETTGYYVQEQLFVTGMGLTTLPMFYDKTTLDAAGIPTKVFEVPEAVRAVLGAGLAGLVEKAAVRVAALLEGEATLGLVVDNEKVDAARLVRHARTGPVGVTYLRK